MKKIAKKGNPSEKKADPITKIDDFLYLGNQQAALSEEIVDSHEIKNILQLVNVNSVPSLEAKVNYLKLPIRGGKNTDIQPVLCQSLKFIFSCVSSSQNILVHCKYGKNRSASIVIAYLMAAKSVTLFEAERYVKQKRPIVEIKRNTKDYLNKLGYRGVQEIMFS